MWKLGMSLAPSFPARVVAKRAKMAEDAGIEYVWVGEEFTRELYITLTTIALNTSKVKLGLGGTNPYTRSAAVIGVSMLTLDELSNGRAVIAMGSGGPGILRKACVRPESPLSTVRDMVTILRELFSGEAVSMKGKEVAVEKLKSQYHNKDIPIYIAGKGPKMMQLAGELCDGVYISGPTSYIKTAVENVRKGAEKTNRTLSDFDIAFMRVLVVDEDHSKAEMQAKRTAPFTIQGLLSDYVLEHSSLRGFKEDCVSLRKSVDQLFENLAKTGKPPPMGYWYELGKYVKKEVLDEIYIYGTPDECIDKIRELQDSEITQVVFTVVPIGGRAAGNYEDAMKMAFEKVLKRI